MRLKRARRLLVAWFEELENGLLDDFARDQWGVAHMQAVIERLDSDTRIIPFCVCTALSLLPGSSYADAARKAREILF